MSKHKKWLILLAAFAAGVIAAPKVRTLPLASKLPTL
jgi:hypothetical protein